MNCIAGVWRLDGAPLEPGALDAPMLAMSDRARVEVETLGAVAFARHTPRPGYEALAPQVLVRGGFAVVADARLDARDDLCRTLGVPASEGAKVGDAELILRSYARWGAGCPEHLIGDYAFAVWDEAARALFCARDHVGARPLFYAHTGRAFVFASTIPGVLAFAGVSAEIDEAEIARFLLSESRGYFQSARTFFTHVHKVPFGHRLRVHATGIRLDRYWRPEDLPPVTLPSDGDYAARLFELVNQALDDRLRDVRHAGVHLSGGLDSSALAVLAGRHARAGRLGLTAFSWSPPPEDTRGSEHDRIADVTTATGLVPRYLPMPMSEAWRFDDDVAVRPRYNALAESGVAREAATAGVDVMVSGWGGDEGASYAGRGIAAAHLARGRWRAFADYCGARAAATGTAGWRKRASVAWHDGCVPLLPRAVFRAVDGSVRRLGPSMIAADFLRRLRPRLDRSIEVGRDVPGGRTNLLRLYHDGSISRRLDAWRTFRAEHGVTYVYPFTDRRVLEFVYSVPACLHVREGVPRYLLRAAVRDVLPVEWLWGRTKGEEARHTWMVAASTPHAREEVQRRIDALRAPHPWIDVERLRAAVRAVPDRALPPAPVDHALAALTTWRHWGDGRR